MEGTIRAYDPADLPGVLDAWEAASVIAHPFLDASFLARERVAIAKEYLPAATTWIWDLRGSSVGFISLLDEEIGGLFVHPTYQRHGIGSALVRHAMEGRSRLEVEVFERNDLGRRFYASLGFRQIGSGIEPDSGHAVLRLCLEVADRVGRDPHEPSTRRSGGREEEPG